MTRWLIYFVIAYLAILVYAYYFSDAQIFYPPRSSYKDDDNIIKIKTENGSEISAIYLPNKKASYTVLVSHGNAEDLGYIMPLLKKFQAHGFSVFAYDYQGYGTSKGKPTEKNAYADIRAAYDYLTLLMGIPAEGIIAYGRSLGAGVAIDLASQKPVAGLIVESPFLTAFRVVTQIPLFPFDKFDNVSKIKKIHVPILVIHGKRDGIIPFWQGKKLYELANLPKKFFEVDDAGHNDVELIAGDAYWSAISQIEQLIRQE